MAWAAANGIVTGYGNGLFGTNDNITRQDLAVILMRYAEFMEYELPESREYTGFKDDADSADYAKDAIKILFSAMVINGKDGNMFDPTGQATRAEVAAMLHRFIEATEE